MEITMRYHFTLVGMLLSERQKTTSVGEDVRKRKIPPAVVGVWIVVAIMENSMEGLQRIENRTTLWLSNPKSESIPKGNKVRISKNDLHSSIHLNIIHKGQDVEQPKGPLKDEWIKTWYIYWNVEKEGHPSICHNMGEPWRCHVEWNKPDAGRQVSLYHTSVWNLSNQNSRKQQVEWQLPGAGTGWTKLHLCKMRKF